MSPILRIAGAIVVVASFAGGIDAAATAIDAPPVATPAPGPVASPWFLDSVPQAERDRIIGILFDAVHPIADAGDEIAAGPIMEIVVHYSPTHYMALYHAGMAARATCRHAAAIQHLSSFLEYYSAEDGWRTNALDALRQLSDSVTTGPSCNRRTAP